MIDIFKNAIISRSIGEVKRVLRYHPEHMMGLKGLDNFMYTCLGANIEIVDYLLKHQCMKDLKKMPRFKGVFDFCISQLQKRRNNHIKKENFSSVRKIDERCELLQNWYYNNVQPKSLDAFKIQLYHELEKETENMSRIDIFKHIFKSAVQYAGVNSTDKNITPEQKAIFDYAKELVRTMTDNADIPIKKILTHSIGKNINIANNRSLQR